jgi:hypothetical protein
MITVGTTRKNNLKKGATSDSKSEYHWNGHFEKCVLQGPFCFLKHLPLGGGKIALCKVTFKVHK